MTNFDKIENGTVPAGLTSSSEFAFPINSGNVVEEVPGSTSSTYYDEGVELVSIDLATLSIVVEGDWTNRRILQNDNYLYIRKNSINRKFFYTTVRPDYSMLVPTTKIILDSATTLGSDLYDFIGTVGVPDANAKVLLSDKIQNPLEENPISYDFKVTKAFDDQAFGIFNVNFSWKNSPYVSKNVLRWRPVPKQNRYTELSFDVLASGAYDSQIVLGLNSSYGSGAAILPINSVTKVEVISGGTYGATVSVVAASPYGSGASFSVSMSGTAPSLSIGSVTVVAGGTGYSLPPTLVIQDSLGSTSPGELKSYIGITGVEIVSQGINYVNPPSITVSGATGASGSLASLTSTTTVYNTGRVDFVQVVDGGSGYVTGEELIFSGGGGTGAKGFIRADNGEIKTTVISEKGYGYTSDPSVTVNTVGGTGATLSAVVTLYSDWNYEYPNASNPSYTVSGLLRDVEYEWQLFSSTENKNEQYFNTSIQRFKFF
jgi:hypothetical protein